MARWAVGAAVLLLALGGCLDRGSLDRPPESAGGGVELTLRDRTGRELGRLAVQGGGTTFAYFGAAASGWNDAGATGSAWLDELIVESEGEFYSDSFGTEPPIERGRAAGGDDALAYDASGGRLRAVGSSAYTCRASYEAVSIGAHERPRVRFQVEFRSQGDGSFFDQYLGLFPDLSQAAVGGSCAPAQPAGRIANFVGLHFEGSGDGQRSRVRLHAAGQISPEWVAIHEGAPIQVELVVSET